MRTPVSTTIYAILACTRIGRQEIVEYFSESPESSSRDEVALHLRIASKRWHAALGRRPTLEQMTANRGVTEHLRRAGELCVTGQICVAGDLRVTGPGYFESFKISRAAF